MFQGIQNTITFAKVVSGISKSLNIVNQLLPLYEKAGPMIVNVKKAYNFITNLNLNKNNENNIINRPIPLENKKTAINNNYFNTPTFFN